MSSNSAIRQGQFHNRPQTYQEYLNILMMTKRHITAQFHPGQLFINLDARNVASSVSPADILLILRVQHIMQTHTVLSTLSLSG